MNNQGIVFDLDGTLADSLAATFEAFNQGIIQHGGQRHTPQEIMKYFGTGEDRIFAQILGEDKALKAYQTCKDYLDSHLGEVPLHTGVPELLETLKSQGVPIAIFTGRSWDTTEMILKHHRILDRFITVIANDHVSLPKPSPEGLHLALTRMKLDPQNTLFIGDSAVDMMASRSAGCIGVGALWDLMAKRELLEPYEPHFCAQTPEEVWHFFQQSHRK